MRSSNLRSPCNTPEAAIRPPSVFFTRFVNECQVCARSGETGNSMHLYGTAMNVRSLFGNTVSPDSVGALVVPVFVDLFARRESL